MSDREEEREPLLANSEGGAASSSLYVSISNDNDAEIGDQSSRGMSRNPSTTSQQPVYGAMSNARALDVVYSWKNINVFCSETRSKKGCLSFCGSESGPPKPMRQILKNVSGEAWPGELLAIMGSSGAGKTTLLNTLTFRSGRELVVGGTRALGKRPMTATYLTSLSAYVQQQDLFIGTLTVREHLIFQSLVRMDKSLTYSKKIQRVNKVISELALTKCQYTMIGIPGRLKGISGGEMKRLSFASEVLTDPPLMFCDEPTSGLDSFMAQNVVQVLKGLAMKGKTVICTIHQPSSILYGMFDKLLLMAEGRVAFLGTPDQASTFFNDIGSPCPKNYNPADFYIQELAVIHSREIESRQRIDDICDTFKKSPQGVKLESANAISDEAVTWDIDDTWSGNQKAGSAYRVSWFSQFAAVLWRSYKSISKEPLLIKVRLIQTILVSGLIGLIYFGQKLNQDGVMNINGALFIFITNMTFQNIFAVINVFCAELNLFLRENRSGLYRTDVYFLAKTIAEIPIFIICPIVFIAICYYMVGMNPDPIRFLWANLIIIMVTTVATSFGYMVSCFCGKVNMALTAGPPLVIPFMLFGGFFLNNASVPWFFAWLSHLSWFKYGNEALMVNQWSNIEEIQCTRITAVCPANGQVVLDSLNFSEDMFYYDLIYLAALVAAFRILAFTALLVRAYRNDV